MASGIIALTRTGSGYLTGQITWSSVSNGTAANTSTVTATLQLQRSALNTTTGTFKGTFTVGGVSESISWYGSLPSKTWVTIKTITATVNHNTDGNGSCYLYALINGPAGTTMEGTSVSGSATVTMDWIPRFASVVSVSGFKDEENPVITYTNPAGTAVDALQACISVDGVHDNISYRDIPKTGTNYTFVLTEAERNTLLAATPNSKTLTVYFYIWSKIGTGESLDSMKATMTVTNDAPVISAEVVDTNSATIRLTGNSATLIANHSTANVTINASARKYATIKSQSVEHGATVLTGNGVLSPVTNHPIKFTVTDSRGNTTTQYAQNTIIPYINPTCIIGNGNPEADGSFALVVTGLCYNGSFGVTNNGLTVQYRYGVSGGSYGAWTTFGTVSKQGNRYTATADITGLDYQTLYTFQARVIDAIHTNGVLSAEKAVISEPVFEWGQYDFRFNVPVTLKDGCDILKNGVAAYAPPGFGLGESNLEPIKDNDANHAIYNGKYNVYASTANGPGINGAMEVSVRTLGKAYQKVIEDNTGCIVQRVQHDGVWQPWEWVNPPMIQDVEYRTTERNSGKTVYCMLIGLGNLPNNTLKTVSLNTTATNIIRIEGMMSYQTTRMNIIAADFVTEFDASVAQTAYVAMKTNTNASIWVADAKIWYTKD